MRTGYVRTNDGVQLYYEEAGTGSDVLLIHGRAMNLRWWKANFDILASRFHVVAVDLRGCGSSDKPAWGHNTARYAKDVHDVLHGLGLHDATLVGWSLGARTCYAYLELFGGERLRGVVIVDDTVHPDLHEPAPPGSGQQPGESDTAFARRSMRRMVSPADPEALADEELSWMLQENGETPAAAAMNAETTKDWRPLCAAIAVPVLVATGRHSGALPGCEYAAQHIPGARLEVFEQSGHALFYTEADKFNRVVADFVYEVTDGGADAQR